MAKKSGSFCCPCTIPRFCAYPKFFCPNSSLPFDFVQHHTCKPGHSVYNNVKDFNCVTIIIIHTEKDAMKAVLIRILRTVVKTYYKLRKKIRRFIVRQRRKKPAFSRPSGQQAVNAPRINTATGISSQPSGAGLFSKMSWWKGWQKSWPLVAGASAVVIIAVVLISVLAKPVADNVTGGAYASLAGAIVTQTPVPTEQTAEAAPAVTQTDKPVSTPVPTDEGSDSTPVPTTAPEEDTPLQPGIHDPRVVELQSRLMDLGYMDNDEPTDYYGGGTKFAIELFQRKHSLQIDGLIGANTQTLLYSDDAMPYTVKMGDKGNDVKEIQERLKELKYFSGSATGDFGEKTESAVKSFQKRNGLSTDGNIGENTREVLFSDDAREARSGSSGGSGGGSSGGGSSGGGSGGKTGPVATDDPDSDKADKLIKFAKTLLGKEYTRGGKGPDDFDCSGYVYYCLNKSDVKSIGYMTSGRWAKSSYPRIDKIGDLERGDIICFKGHVGIYMGNGKMIHASSSADKVIINDGSIFSSSWCKRNFICGRRVL